MLWFNGNRSTLTYTVNSNFNTSYVVVQPRVSRIALQRGTNFNTSYVVVQHEQCTRKYTHRYISIHLMLWFNDLFLIPFSFLYFISIHLMLWFNIPASKNARIKYSISIHLMLWFNEDLDQLLEEQQEFQYILCCGSTIFFLVYCQGVFSFQYILCCGSTLFVINIKGVIIYFNTSYVVVQLFLANHSNPCVQISIHLMLWFNLIPHNTANLTCKFQYILCCGSTFRLVTVA